MSEQVIRVAVASKEGRAISEHFGHTRAFYIYDLTTDGHLLVEQREVHNYCLGGSSGRVFLNNTTLVIVGFRTLLPMTHS